MRYRASLLLLAAVALPAQAWAPLQSVRVLLPAQITHDGAAAALLPHKPVDEGDTVSTGGNGRVTLEFAGHGTLTLGGDSELFVHSAETAAQGSGDLLRLQLLHGALTLEPAPAGAAGPVQDFRIDVGGLELRALNAGLWVAADDNGASVCLQSGAAEITAGNQTERLDQSGQCLQRDRSSGMVSIDPGPSPQLQERMTQTAFPAFLSPGGTPAQTGADAASGTTAPVPAQPQRRASGNWTVVVASLADAGAAQAMARKLRAKKLHAEVRANPASADWHRVTVGSYETRELAARQAVHLKHTQHLRSVWVTQIP
ncbi:MAG: SPOR domain-containing protein [Stenotrophobium sp.]